MAGAPLFDEGGGVMCEVAGGEPTPISGGDEDEFSNSGGEMFMAVETSSEEGGGEVGPGEAGDRIVDDEAVNGRTARTGGDHFSKIKTMPSISRAGCAVH